MRFFLKKPSPELKAFLVTAASALPSAQPLPQNNLDEKRLISIKRILAQEQISHGHFSDVILHSRQLREDVVEVATTIAFDKVSHREPTKDEMDLLKKFFVARVLSLKPHVPEEYFEHVARTLQTFENLRGEENAQDFDEAIIASVEHMRFSVLPTSIEGHFYKPSPLELLGLVQRYVLQDADAPSQQHVPWFFSCVLSAPMPSEWPDPEFVQTRFQNQLRLQISYMDRTKL